MALALQTLATKQMVERTPEQEVLNVQKSEHEQQNNRHHNDQQRNSPEYGVHSVRDWTGAVVRQRARRQQARPVALYGDVEKKAEKEHSNAKPYRPAEEERELATQNVGHPRYTQHDPVGRLL
jgi:hypothetical protein